MRNYLTLNLLKVKACAYQAFSMKKCGGILLMAIGGIGIFSSCNTLEKASLHGMYSGFYTFKADTVKSRSVYADVTDEKIALYPHTKKQTASKPFLSLPLQATSDSTLLTRMVFSKKSLDIDITSILFKYRPAVYGLPAQVTTDLNMALYAGWRHDYFQLLKKKDVLGRDSYKMSARGFDFGFFAGPGATLVSPITTRNHRSDEYNALVLQTGVAVFLESHMASFGLAVGYDFLMSPDRKVWIYTNAPWLGFVVGIALN